MFRRIGAIVAAAAVMTVPTVSAAQADVGAPSSVVVTSQTAAVGVLTPVTLTITSTGGIDPTGSTATFSVNGTAIATAPLSFDGALWNSSITWMPTQPGLNYVTATWGAGSADNVATVNVSAIGTATTVTSPSYAKLGTWVPVTITVSPSAGMYTPQGTVLLTSTTGTNQTLTLSPSAGATASATFSYFAGTAGTVTFNAVYVPATGATTSSTAAPDMMNVNASGAAVNLSVPGAVTVGVPTTVTLSTAATATGWATLTANGTTVAYQQYFTGGKTSFAWTPPTTGTWNLAASVTAPNGTVYTGSDSVSVILPSVTDTITLTVNGYGALSSSTAFQAANGSEFTLLPSAASGATVSVTETGPCTLNGNVLVIPTGTGSCKLTATSPGGNGFSAATVTYPVTLVPGQQDGPNPKANGRYAKGSKLLLGPAGETTSAGQSVTWKVTSGKSSCTVIQAGANMKVKLSKKRGVTCNVKGSAPGVSGEWNAFTVYRSYTTR